jgi:hypothetical protein
MDYASIILLFELFETSECVADWRLGGIAPPPFPWDAGKQRRTASQRRAAVCQNGVSAKR